MDRILIILKKENGPRASSTPELGLNTILSNMFIGICSRSQVSVYRTIGPLVFNIFLIFAQNIDCGYTLEPPGLDPRKFLCCDD